MSSEQKTGRIVSDLHLTLIQFLPCCVNYLNPLFLFMNQYLEMVSFWVYCISLPFCIVTSELNTKVTDSSRNTLFLKFSIKISNDKNLGVWLLKYILTLSKKKKKPVELLPKIRICLINYGIVLMFYKPTTDVNITYVKWIYLSWIILRTF